MTSSPHSLVFFDTNVFLHFKPIQQIDWQALFASRGIDATDLHFVIARVTLRELDKHKNEHKNPTIRQRATRVLRELETAFVESLGGTPHMVREMFPLIVQPNDNEIDFDAYRLRRSSADDELIAAMLWHRLQVPEPALFLLSNDGGLRITALSHKMRVLVPGEADKLPSEEDAITKELKTLRTENAALKNKEPRLALMFVKSALVEAQDRIVVSIPAVPAEPVEAWEKAMAAAAARAPVIVQPPDDVESQSVSAPVDEPKRARLRIFDLSQLDDSGSRWLSSISAEEYVRYANQREAYFAEYKDNLRASWDAWNKDRRSLLLQLELQNVGSVPADEIDVSFHIPDGPEAELVSQFEMELAFEPAGKVPFIPAAPAPPPAPRTRMQMLMLGTNPSFAPFMPTMPHFGPPAPRGLVLRRTNSFEGAEQFKRLKHGYSMPLGVLRLWFPPAVAPQGFQITYQITAANSATPTTGVLHVRVLKLP